MGNSKKIAVNTVILYAKTLINIVVALYSTRLILEGLGVTDYGIYNLIGGVIALLSFIKASMSSSSLRFLSYELGKGNVVEINKLFNSNVLLHVILSVSLVFLLEIAGIPFLDTLQIPANRMDVAEIVFHFMVINTFFTINSVPYEGLLFAKEDMLAFASIGIFESILKFILAFSIQYVSFDKLIYYSGAMVFLTIIVRGMSVIYCKKKYEESKGSFLVDSSWRLVRKMSSFAGWNTFGAFCSVGRSQGLAIVLNMFFGVVVNAAYGIANQVNAQLNFFSQSMLVSLRPQIMKSEGAGDRKSMLMLSMVASKFSFYLLSFVAIPVILELPLLLKIWLTEIPDDTIMFCRMVILLNLVVQLSVGLMIAVQSVGKISYYQVTIGSMVLASIPLGYFFFTKNFPPHTILIIAIVIEIIATVGRLLFSKHLVGLNIKDYLYNVVLRGIIPVLLTFYLVLQIHNLFSNEWLQLIAVCISSTIILTVSIYYLGMNNFEQGFVLSAKEKIMKKIKNYL